MEGKSWEELEREARSSDINKENRTKVDNSKKIKHSAHLPRQMKGKPK